MANNRRIQDESLSPRWSSRVQSSMTPAIPWHTSMMTFPARTPYWLPGLIFVFSPGVAAFPLPSSLVPQAFTSTPASEPWSKEAIIALIGVCIALACFVIGLAWKPLRSCFRRYIQRGRNLFARERQGTNTQWRRNQEETRQHLQDQYNSLLEIRRGGF
ncbi:hypothetical protein HBH49_080380 [Parastagonospora nodorum]|nr:hypothetical protein HBH49_080380 [Parastagonospora nodorum]